MGKLESVFSEGEAETIRQRVDDLYEEEKISDMMQLLLRTEDPRSHYEKVQDRGSAYSYYRVKPGKFDDSESIITRRRTEMLPYQNEIPTMHKYTVVMWLEGDDPQCTNELMGAHIGLNFQIKGDEEDFMSEIVTPVDPAAEIS